MTGNHQKLGRGENGFFPDAGTRGRLGSLVVHRPHTDVPLSFVPSCPTCSPSQHTLPSYPHILRFFRLRAWPQRPLQMWLTRTWEGQVEECGLGHHQRQTLPLVTEGVTGNTLCLAPRSTWPNPRPGPQSLSSPRERSHVCAIFIKETLRDQQVSYLKLYLADDFAHFAQELMGSGFGHPAWRDCCGLVRWFLGR